MGDHLNVIPLLPFSRSWRYCHASRGWKHAIQRRVPPRMITGFEATLLIRFVLLPLRAIRRDCFFVSLLRRTSLLLSLTFGLSACRSAQLHQEGNCAERLSPLFVARALRLLPPNRPIRAPCPEEASRLSARHFARQGNEASQRPVRALRGPFR